MILQDSMEHHQIVLLRCLRNLALLSKQCDWILAPQCMGYNFQKDHMCVVHEDQLTQKPARLQKLLPIHGILRLLVVPSNLLEVLVRPNTRFVRLLH